MLRSQFAQSGMAEVVDHLVALEHLAEHGEQVGLTGAERAVDVPANVAVVVEALSDRLEEQIQPLADLLADDVLADVPANPVRIVGEARDERVQVRVVLPLEIVPDLHSAFPSMLRLVTMNF